MEPRTFRLPPGPNIRYLKSAFVSVEPEDTVPDLNWESLGIEIDSTLSVTPLESLLTKNKDKKITKNPNKFIVGVFQNKYLSLK